MRFAMMLSIILFSFPVFSEWQENQFQNTTIYNYIPKAQGKKALMLNLHGCRQKNTEIIEFANWEESAEKWNMIISAPEAPDGGVYFECWDYFGRFQNTQKKHAAYLIAWIEKLLSDKELNIDPNQVYISGFSSGGGMTMVLSCLRPDLFAGVGISSGPSVGTWEHQSTFPATNSKKAAKVCMKMAGPYREFLGTQVASIIHGDFDMVVTTLYNNINSRMYRILSGADLEKSTLDLQNLNGDFKKGKANVWSDGRTERVSHIMIEGLGHRWPSGSAEKTGGYCNGESINYPEYLSEFLITNNQRDSNE